MSENRDVEAELQLARDFNRDMTAECEGYKNLVWILRARVKELEAQLAELGPGPFVPKHQYDNTCKQREEAFARVKELEAALRLALSAMQKNIAYATRKDEPALAEAIPVARRALQGNTDTQLTARDVQVSYDRLRARVKRDLGEDLPAVTYIQCDSCGAVRPSGDIDHHSPSGINMCKGPHMGNTDTGGGRVYQAVCRNRGCRKYFYEGPDRPPPLCPECSEPLDCMSRPLTDERQE